MKKVLSLMVAVVLLLTVAFTGCSSTTGSPDATKAPDAATPGTSSDTEATPESSSDTEASPAPSGDTGSISWDTADLSWKKDVSPVTFDCYIDFDWYALDTWGKDEVSQEITKRTGVSLNVTKSSDLNQLQVLLAADELPEIIFTSNQVSRFYKPDLCFPFDELINQYCPEFMQLIDPVEIVNNTVSDGHFYTLKSHYNSQQAWDDPRNVPSPGDSGLYYRQDILEALGNPKLESLEDLVSIFAQVKEKYPDMVVYLPHPTWASPILEFIGANNGKDVLEDGSMVYGPTTEEWKQYALFLNSLYRAGYLSAEAYTYKPEQFFQIYRAGDVFSASYNSSIADDANKTYDENGITGHWVPVMTPLTYQGKQNFQPVDASVGWASLFISKNCKNPERAIKYMEFLKSPEGDQLTQWGIEGKHYTLNEEGLLVRPEGFDKLTVQDTGIGPWYFMASGLGEGVAVSSGKLTSPKYSQGVDLLKWRKGFYLRDPARYFTTPDADTDESVIETKLNELRDISITKIITSKTEDEALAAYNQFVADMQKTGVEQLNTFYTTKYKEAQTKYAGLNK